MTKSEISIEMGEGESECRLQQRSPRTRAEGRQPIGRADARTDTAFGFTLSDQDEVTRVQLRSSVLIVDDDALFREGLAHSFKRLGYTVQTAADMPSALTICQEARVGIVVAEQRIGNRLLDDEVPALRRVAPDCHIVIATAYPSIAHATRAVRRGIDCYVAKPVNACLILDNLNQAAPRSSPHASWPSLDLTIWEYINSVFVASGSMSEAARRLHLDRRSLRRMLSKHPPAR